VQRYGFRSLEFIQQILVNVCGYPATDARHAPAITCCRGDPAGNPSFLREALKHDNEALRLRPDNQLLLLLAVSIASFFVRACPYRIGVSALSVWIAAVRIGVYAPSVWIAAMRVGVSALGIWIARAGIGRAGFVGRRRKEQRNRACAASR
jgi:hypothetical protein